TIALREHASPGRARHDIDRSAWISTLVTRRRAQSQPLAIMLCRHLLALPVHASCALVIHLHAIHPHVALSGSRIARDYARQRDEASSVLGPAFQDWEVEQ